MKRFARAILVVAATFVALPGSAEAWCRTTTSEAMPASPTECVTDGAPLFWERRCQQFSLDRAAGAGLSLTTVRNVVTASFDAWNAATCSGLPAFSVTEGPTVACDQAEYASNDGNSNTIAFASDFSARMFPLDAIAITVVWHNTDTGQIYDADLIVNEDMGPFATCPDAGCPIGTTGFDLRNVITHEAGHFLGLAHSADSAATMFYRADQAETAKRTLATDDIAGFCAAYGGATIPAECDPTPRHGFDADCVVEPAKDEGRCSCTTAGATKRANGSVALAFVVLAVTASRRLRSRES